MAARKQLWHPDSVREKIRASQLVNRLQDHAEGKLDKPMDATQVAAALGLLDRCVPKLAAQEIRLQGNVVIQDGVDRPPRETREEWLARRASDLAAIPPAGSAE